MHLVIDGYGGDAEKLRSVEAAMRFLADTPDAIGMKRISPVEVYQYHGATPEQCGVSGFVMIAESHLSLHTWPEHGAIWADIFSCKDFRPATVVETLRQAFGLRETKATLLQRGLEPVVSLPDGPVTFLSGAA